MAAAGDRYGRWTLVSAVVGDGPGKWIAYCACGTRRQVLLTKLVTGRSRSCGCTRAEMHGRAMAAALQPRGAT